MSNRARRKERRNARALAANSGPAPTDDPTESLKAFRTELRGCFPRWGDALFDLCDAVLCSASPITSLPYLSLEAEFTRSHGSLYKSLDLGLIDEERLRQLLAVYRPVDWPDVFAVDASTWPRVDAETSPERGFCHSASKTTNGRLVAAGWEYQWVSQLNWSADSWTAPVDTVGIKPQDDATNITIDQVKRLTNLLPAGQTHPMYVFDAGYDPAAISHELIGWGAQVLVRVSSRRTFYPDAAEFVPGGRG